MFTWTIGALGAAASYWIGSSWLGFSPVEIALQIVVANFAAFVGGILTLQAEKVRWIKKWLIPDGVRTWAFLVLIFVGIELALAPGLRSLDAYVRMFFPLLMSTALMFQWGFGPAQDWLVRRAQLKMRRERVISS